MKTKHTLPTLLISGLLGLGLITIKGYAARTDNFIPIEKSYEAFSCPSSINVYLNQDNDADGLPDQFLYLNSNFILSHNTPESYAAGQILREDINGNIKSKIRYYTPLSGMVYKIASGGFIGPLDNYTFWRASWVFPYNTPIRGIATTPNKIVFEKPYNNNTGKTTVGFYYDYVYKYAIGRDGTTTSNYWYNQIPNMNYLGNTYVSYVTTLPGPHGNRKRARSSEKTYSVCRDYKLHRCGDGIIDTYSPSSRANAFSGEICDDGPLNGTPGRCPANCGNISTQERCGDNIVQPAGTNYNGNPNTPSFEACDDGDLAGDNGDGILNGDDPAFHFCSSICLPTFSEAFTEEFVNG